MIQIQRKPLATRIINKCQKYIFEDETYLMTKNNCYLNGEYYGKVVKSFNNTFNVLLESDDSNEGVLVHVSFK